MYKEVFYTVLKLILLPSQKFNYISFNIKKENYLLVLPDLTLVYSDWFRGQCQGHLLHS